MVEIDVQIVTCKQMEQLQRQFLKATFNGEVAAVTDKSLESDGRRRGRVLKEAVNAGLLVATSETSSNGQTYHITSEVIASVVPRTLALFEIWLALHEKNPHREPYDRPWLRVEDLSIEVQCGVLKTEDIDWFVVSRSPYEYRANFADAPETILADVSPFHAFNQYWAGPFATLEDALPVEKRFPARALPRLRKSCVGKLQSPLLNGNCNGSSRITSFGDWSSLHTFPKTCYSRPMASLLWMRNWRRGIPCDLHPIQTRLPTATQLRGKPI